MADLTLAVSALDQQTRDPLPIVRFDLDAQIDATARLGDPLDGQPDIPVGPSFLNTAAR
jgi:hypothetical protein